LLPTCLNVILHVSIVACRKALQEKEVLDDVDTSSDEELDEDKYADQADMAGQKVDMKSRQTVRNLRIREDIPKYLRNLDIQSAYYDPKTRSMRDNPNKEKAPDDLEYAGDNFMRFTGETRNMTETMVFAWQAAERGNDVHLQANPSQAEFLYKEYLKKKDEVHERQKSSILDRYGGAEHLQKPPTELLEQSEHYVEYSRTGKVIKGIERATVRSRYMEDVFPQNHTSVWGSYWKDGQWGYACCHATTYNSYCTGEAGKEAASESARFQANLAGSAPKRSLMELEQEREPNEKGKYKKSNSSANDSLIRKRKHLLGDGEIQLSEEKLAKALERERKRKVGDKFQDVGIPADVTEEDLEAHRILRHRTDDPMLNFPTGDDV
jgi:pre-mRNA-processing factor SLU7